MAYAVKHRVIPFKRRGLSGDVFDPTTNSYIMDTSAFGPTASTTAFINALTSGTGAPIALPAGVGAAAKPSWLSGNMPLYIAGALLLAFFLMSKKG